MKKCLLNTLVGIIVGITLVPQMSLAATGWVSGNVSRVLTMNDKFGTCMAMLSAKNNSLSCSTWVTFDCEGNLEGNTKAVANAKFNAAQLALVTGNQVRVQIDDSKKINGQCFAPRIDVYSN